MTKTTEKKAAPTKPSGFGGINRMATKKAVPRTPTKTTPAENPLNVKQNTAKRKGMAERAADQLKAYFPDVPAERLWLRQKNKGFTTLPRTMPIVMEIIDSLSKGQPAGHTLFSLWCRAPDNPLVVIQNPIIFASEAGFTGERAVDTWRRRMKSLQKHGFIQTKSGITGDFHYVLLMNPHIIIEQLKQEGGPIQGELYRKFLDRIMEIGAQGDIEIATNLRLSASAKKSTAKTTKTARKPRAGEES